ncbi:hypothetical protein SAMN05216298_3995 [Glycomyces sambucus]|uniref:Uncharacterized protein n=1 Tax=Glycomyces sambucus TaxID=380244 RepID=A0A1G9KD81_9ACTN|nr:hypothetical protein [Glycomyces sambucus]SDL47681.1 hypothetical protein SAMN05216298_3995 [Glycomyces sambucus]
MTELDELGVAELGDRLKLESPGGMSVAGAFAFGYGAIGMRQEEQCDALSWYGELGPLEVLFLGMIFPKRFTDEHELANALFEWMQRVRSEKVYEWICEFVNLVVERSFEVGIPVDDRNFMLSLNHYLEMEGFHRYRIPQKLLPERVLRDSRIVTGFRNVDLGELDRSREAEAWLRWFWEDPEKPYRDPTVLEALRSGLRHLLGREHEGAAGKSEVIIQAMAKPSAIIHALYLSLAAGPDEAILDLPTRSYAWISGLREESAIWDVADAAITAADRAWTLDDALLAVKDIAGMNVVVESRDRQWKSSPLVLFREVALKVGHGGILARNEPEWTSSSCAARARKSAMELLREVEFDLRHIDLVAKHSTATDLSQRRANYDGSVTVSIPPSAVAGMRSVFEEQHRVFRETFGREPASGDPIFWDPDRTDEPVYIDPDVFQAEFEQDLQTAAAEFEDLRMRAMTLACADFGMIVVETNLHTFTTEEIAEYNRLFAHHLAEEQARALILDPGDEAKLIDISSHNSDRIQMRAVLDAVKRRASELDRDRGTVLAELHRATLAVISRELPELQLHWGDGTPDESLRSFVDEESINLRDSSILSLTVDAVVGYGTACQVEQSRLVGDEVILDWMQVLNEVAGFDEVE